VSTASLLQGWNFVKDNDKNNGDGTRMARTRQRAIGRELRRMYDSVAREPIPQEFLDLLRKIDDGKGGSEGS
jgi:hypothetical protein